MARAARQKFSAPAARVEIEIEGVRPASRFLSWVGKSGKIAAADFYSLISKAKPLTVVIVHRAPATAQRSKRGSFSFGADAEKIRITESEIEIGDVRT